MRKKLSGDGRQSLLDYWTDYCGGRAGYGGYLVGEREKSEQSQSGSHPRKVGWAGLELFPVSCRQTDQTHAWASTQDTRQAQAGTLAASGWGPSKWDKEEAQCLKGRKGRKASVDLTWPAPGLKARSLPSFSREV